MERVEREVLQRHLERMADGDRDAFHPVFVRLWPLVRGFAARCLPREDAEDAAQEALLRVFARAAEFDRQRDALSWVLGIAAYEIRSARKRRQRRREERTDALTERPDPSHSPEAAAAAGEAERALVRAAAAIAVAAVALVGCPAPGRSVSCAAALGVVLAASLWRGGAWARGARLGFLAGLAPCLLPAAARAVHACCVSVCPSPPAVCLTAGVVAGLLLGWLGLRLHGDRRLWLAAVTTAVLAGAIGCLAVGLAGLGGMAVGILAGAATPVLAARAA